MNPEEVDYSKFTVEQLLDVKRSINPNVAPENYEKLCTQLELRKEEIEEHVDKKKEAFVCKTKKRVKILGYFQVATAIILVFFLLYNLFTYPSALAIITLKIAVSFNGIAGYLLIKQVMAGYYLSLVNLGLQTLSINTGTFYFSYNGIGGVFLTIREGVFLSALFKPGYSIAWGENVGPPGISIDLLAVFFILVLLSAIKLTNQSANQAIK